MKTNRKPHQHYSICIVTKKKKKKLKRHKITHLTFNEKKRKKMGDKCDQSTSFAPSGSYCFIKQS